MSLITAVPAGPQVRVLSTTGGQQRTSTRLAFLVAGLAMATWAPLVPYAKARLGLDESMLGLLLLCLGAGSIFAMPATGVLTGRYGCRPVIVCAGLVICVSLPMLAWAPSVPLLALTLFFFGGSVGMVDVAMNIQAVAVEKAAGVSLMSGFHGLYSVGGLAGAGGMAALLHGGVAPLAAAGLSTSVIFVALLLSASHHMRRHASTGREGPLFVLPRGPVALIGALCFITFLAEGAMLDWSALFLTHGRGLDTASGGLGYALFAGAMTVGRLGGDRIVRRFGGRRVLFFGSLCAAAGFFLAVAVPAPEAALCGFLLIGLGASNIVPLLYTAAGNQASMPASLGISSVSLLGYLGILAGPALVGFLAHASSLGFAFGCIGASLLLVTMHSRLGRIVRTA